MKKKKLKIGLALGGGGAKGLAHIGVLKTLEKQGISPDYVAGTSMGALMGAYYSLDLDLNCLEKEALSLNKKIAIKKFIDLNNPKISLIKGKKIEKYINVFTRGATFGDLKKNFRVVATDLATGQEVVLFRGDLAKALMASICVPGIFPPIKINERYLVDGGLVNNTPVDVVENMGADIVIGVDLTMKKESKLDNPGIFSSLMHSYEIMRTQGVKLKIKNVHKKLIVVMPKIRKPIDSFKFYDTEKFIESGKEATEEALPQILKFINEKK